MEGKEFIEVSTLVGKIIDTGLHTFRLGICIIN